MKLTPQERRIVEICRRPISYGKKVNKLVDLELDGMSNRLMDLVAKLSHSLEARAKRKARVKVVRGWVGHDHHGFGKEVLKWPEDHKVKWLGVAPATLTISLPRKVRGK